MSRTETIKRSFVMYHDQYEIIKGLDDHTIGKIMRAVFEYAELGKEPEFDPLTNALFLAFRTTMDRDMEKYRSECRKRAEAGRKGGKATQEKLKQKQALLKDTKANQGDSDSENGSDSESDISKTVDVISKSSEASENAKEQSKPKEAEHMADVCSAFDRCWAAYGKKVGRAPALKRWKRMSDGERDRAERSIPAYVQATPDLKFRKHFSTWLNQEGWEDEVGAVVKNVQEV